MEGLRDKWSVPSSETKADYRNLPFGTYTFKVLAIGAAQKWSQPFEYTFTILPPSVVYLVGICDLRFHFIAPDPLVSGISNQKGKGYC